MSNRLDNKVAIVTGGTSGIGAGVARLFAAEGAKVVFAGRNEERGKAVEEEIKTSGGEAMFVRADIKSTDEVANLVETTIEKYGKIDILIANAGISPTMPAVDMPEETFMDVISTNFISVQNLVQKTIPYMEKAGKGSVVVTASAAAIAAAKGAAAYCSSKAGVNMLTKVWALEYADKGIRFNIVCPGPVKSGMIPDELVPVFAQMTPMKKVATTDEIAYAYLFLASDESAFCTGHSLVCDGGQTLGPLLG